MLLVGSWVHLKHFFLEKLLHQEMGTLRFYILLLPLLFGSIHRGISQFPEWNGELEGEIILISQPNFIDDTYWSGSAPLCLGGCKARHRELRRDRCGDSSCCWLGYKSLCRVNCGRPDVDYNGVVYGNDWWVESVVRYTCRSGFRLIGNSTRSCQPNGLWTPKPICLRMCKQGQIEISESELSGTCNSTCVGKSYFGPPKRGCTQLDNCRKKETGWKRFFAQCVPCICDCAFSCVSAG
ncbi:sushi, von Willebrand factor type A, EGF and pentraxin domain-containing protein 1 isoform X2 [Oreochromis niloticus]|uniref:sushi, von Willebrand factor type A, EGF and pentraxin domain-containing protein 1 isoform X2 n=1 Tax=Oreochromis niloticus TaxID=8128 RepID=UPI0003945274|nr:sushi, von Willebrand factor type A, EGF and pentraxin domain-containing protein 1 isoform X2 [Oreochromis niloticus]